MSALRVGKNEGRNLDLPATINFDIVLHVDSGVETYLVKYKYFLESLSTIELRVFPPTSNVSALKFVSR